MYYKSKNAKLLLNGSELIVNEANLSLSAQIDPIYQETQRHSFTYQASNGINGGLSISYFLTGQDFLKNFFYDEINRISGNFGGLYFNSGYLSSYALNFEANKPVQCNAQIVFFEDLKGSFSPIPAIIRNTNVLNFANASIQTTQGGENFNNLERGSYQFQAKIEPVYLSTDNTGSNVTPDRIYFGEKIQTMNVIVDILSGDLPIYGKASALTLTLSNLVNSSNSESFSISGVIQSKNISSSVGSSIKNSISIVENNVYNPPIISNFIPISGFGNTSVQINGFNLIDTNYVYIGDRQTSFNIVNDNVIAANVPIDGITGPIKVSTNRGNTISSSNFNILYSPIIISDLIPRTGSKDDVFLITGSNFYRIESVLFISGSSYISGAFNNSSPSIIRAIVPSGLSQGQISVIANTRGISGQSNIPFVPIPIINDFNPKTGIAGTVINVQGFHLQNTQQILMGSGYVSIFSVVNDNSVNFTVPIPNSALPPTFSTLSQKGPIQLTANSLTVTSDNVFRPTVIITGIMPNNGRALTIFNLSGINIYPDLLYSIGPNQYKIYMNGENATGSIAQVGGINYLSVIVPSGAKTGPVYIYGEDGISVYESFTGFTKRYNPPIGIRTTHSGGYSGSGLSMTLFGENFYNVTGIRLSGSGSIRTEFSIPTQYWTGDFFGNKMIINNFPLATGAGIGGQGVGTGIYHIKILTPEGTGIFTGQYLPFKVLSPNLGRFSGYVQVLVSDSPRTGPIYAQSGVFYPFVKWLIP